VLILRTKGLSGNNHATFLRGAANLGCGAEIDSSRRFLASLVCSTNGDLARAEEVIESRVLTLVEEAPRRISALQAERLRHETAPPFASCRAAGFGTDIS
jgi:hypothetical protein